MDPALAGLIGAGLGGVIGLTGYYISYRLQIRVARRAAKRKELRELAIILIDINGFPINLSTDYGEMLSRLWGLRKRLKLNSLYCGEFRIQSNRIFLKLEGMAKSIIQNSAKTPQQYVAIVSNIHPDISTDVEDLLTKIGAEL